MEMDGNQEMEEMKMFVYLFAAYLHETQFL